MELLLPELNVALILPVELGSDTDYMAAPVMEPGPLQCRVTTVR